MLQSGVRRNFRKNTLIFIQVNPGFSASLAERKEKSVLLAEAIKDLLGGSHTQHV